LPTSLANLVDDAERLDPNLVPSAQELAGVVGVLVKQVEGIVGHVLPPLAADALGLEPAPAAQAPPAAAPAAATQDVGPAQTQPPGPAREAELEAELRQLRGQVTPDNATADSGSTGAPA